MKNIYSFNDTTFEINIPKRYKVKNDGFKIIKNVLLKFFLQTCSKTTFDKKKHLRGIDFGYKSLQQLDSLGKRRWEYYFKNGGTVYIERYKTDTPPFQKILFDKSVKKFITKGSPLPTKPKPIKRGYSYGGKSGKIDGFNYYLNQKGKLSRKQRNDLLKRGNIYIGELVDRISKMKVNNERIKYLDSNWTDIELMDYWNDFFMSYGNLIIDLMDNWEKLYLKGKTFGDTNSEQLNVNLEKLGRFKPVKLRVKDMG
jgi:hypothetical protein